MYSKMCFCYFCSRPADFLSLSSRDTCKMLFIKRSYPLRHMAFPFNVHSFGQVMDYVQNMTVHSLTSNRARLEIGMLFSLFICIDSFQKAFCFILYKVLR